MAVAVGVVLDAEGAEAPSGELPAEALEANRQLLELAGGLIEENAGLRAATSIRSRRMVAPRALA